MRTRSIVETAIGLGYVCGEAWACCPARSRSGHDCVLPRGHTSDYCMRANGIPFRGAWKNAKQPLPSSISELAEQWVAEGGDPQRGPVLEWTNGRCSWSVNEFGANIRAGQYVATRRLPDYHWDIGGNSTPIEDMADGWHMVLAADGLEDPGWR